MAERDPHDGDRAVESDKRELRARMKAARRALPEAEVRRASAAVCARLAALPVVAGARTIALYAACDGELDGAAAASGKRAIYPRIASARSDGLPPRLSFAAVDAAHPLAPGRYGLLAPGPDAAEVPLADADVVVVPGLAFDSDGRRLGQGGGFYDAALAAAPAVPRVAICHEFQLVPRVPATDRDARVDLVVTPAGAYPTGARPFVSLGGIP